MIKIPSLLLASFLIAILGCSHFENGHNGHHSTIKLDGSEKWEMDSHTRNVFQRMDQRIQGLDFDSMKDAERQQLGVDLNDDIKVLIQGCTMQGKAHDALHEYMVTLMKAVNDLADCGCVKNAKTVERQLEAYQRFFF